MPTHQNMFAYFETKAEVYRKLQMDFRSETNKVVCSNMFTSLSLFFGTYFSHSKWSPCVFLVAGVSALYGLQLFIDLSNRNFALHVIDWIEAGSRTEVSGKRETS